MNNFGPCTNLFHLAYYQHTNLTIIKCISLNYEAYKGQFWAKFEKDKLEKFLIPALFYKLIKFEFSTSIYHS